MSHYSIDEKTFRTVRILVIFTTFLSISSSMCMLFFWLFLWRTNLVLEQWIYKDVMLGGFVYGSTIAVCLLLIIIMLQKKSIYSRDPHQKNTAIVLPPSEGGENLGSTSTPADPVTGEASNHSNPD